jgi:hypothetical protein
MIKFVLTAALTLVSSAAAAERIDPASIIRAVTGDWNGDGESDLALLVAPPEPATTSASISTCRTRSMRCSGW